MTAATTEPLALVMPEPVGKQAEWLSSSASRKVLRIGRRGSKTRFAFIAGMLGHGPGWESDAPKFPGVMQGKDVIWISQTYSNLSTVLWREEIIPRMAHLPWVGLNVQQHDVNVRGLGSLLLRSGDREAIDSVRGVGSKLGGVIVDEAAHLDLRGALQDVILPSLLDNGGWLILMSTTNAAQDGGYADDGSPQVPSYFNLICEEIRAGKRSNEWQEFTGTAYDNPTLSPQAIDELIAEYPPGSPKLEQEVFAKLLRSGVGLALPHITAETHMVERHGIPEHWTQWGGFDWGYNHPWVFGWYACDDDGNVVKLETVWGHADTPDQIVATILASCPAVKRRDFVVHAGHDIFDKKGYAIGYKGPTIAEQMQSAGIKVTKGNNNRVLGLDNLRRYTALREQVGPRFVLMDTEGNRRCLSQLMAMQLDPGNLEDALKVNADLSGRGGDDSYDETRYALMARPVPATLPPEPPYKVAHLARPLAGRIKDGKLVPAEPEPRTLDELVQWAQKRKQGRERVPMPQRERVPRW